MSKRKVQTLTNRNRWKREEKIRSVLANFPEGTTPKIIALYTKIPQSSVRGMLMRGVPGVEKMDIRGLYRLVHKSRVVPIFSYNFHNFLCVTYIPDYIGSQVSKTLSSDLTNFAFEIGKVSKQATLRVSTKEVNGTNYPFNMSSLTIIFQLFKEWVNKYANVDITMEDVIVKSIEFNKDYSNLKLEGVNCITLSNLIEQFKIYQKELSLRVEHKITVPITANELIKLLGVEL